jgi:8-oxo-dGTP pyrophosphatase MutT (NUDIX family)
MVSRQRVVLVFLRRDVDGKVLLAPRPRAAPVYGGRLSTVGGEVEAGEALEVAADRALTAELGAGVATHSART